jgi:RNA polymerase sigma-70 factor, ECF subfamily
LASALLYLETEGNTMNTPSTTNATNTIPTRKSRKARSEVRDGLAALRPDLYARAIRLTRSPALADDVVQETMLRALRFEKQYRAGTNLRAWVGQVLMSVFLTNCRRKKRERRAMDRLHCDPAAWPKKDTRTCMQSLSARPAEALASLPEGYRKAVQLVDIQELSYREAANRLEVPVGTIMSRLHRGRKMLAAQLVDTAAEETTPLAA